MTFISLIFLKSYLKLSTINKSVIIIIIIITIRMVIIIIRRMIIIIIIITPRPGNTGLMSSGGVSSHGERDPL